MPAVPDLDTVGDRSNPRRISLPDRTRDRNALAKTVCRSRMAEKRANRALDEDRINEPGSGATRKGSGGRPPRPDPPPENDDEKGNLESRRERQFRPAGPAKHPRRTSGIPPREGMGRRSRNPPRQRNPDMHKELVRDTTFINQMSPEYMMPGSNLIVILQKPGVLCLGDEIPEDIHRENRADKEE